LGAVPKVSLEYGVVGLSAFAIVWLTMFFRLALPGAMRVMLLILYFLTTSAFLQAFTVFALWTMTAGFLRRSATNGTTVRTAVSSHSFLRVEQPSLPLALRGSGPMTTKSELKPTSEASPTTRVNNLAQESADSDHLTGVKTPISRGPQRVVWIDHLKAWGIFLVVYGHSLYRYRHLSKWIYAFHIPLFFLISGYLIKESHLAEKPGSFLRRTAKSLLLPYVIFAVIGYFFWFFVERKFGKSLHAETPPISPILAALYGTGKLDNFHVEPLVLWFLPCLFVAQVLFYLANQAKGRTAYAISIVLCAIGMLLPKWLALPFQFETALVAQGFIMLGFETKKRKWLAFAAGRPLVLGLGLLAIGTALALLNGNIDMRGSMYGIVPLFLLGSIGLSLSFALLLMKVPRLSLSEIISRNTIIIFSFHPMVFSIFSAIYVFVLKQNLTFRENPAVSLVSSIINCLLLAIVAEALTRTFPRLLKR
jgi:acyltransferase